MMNSCEHEATSVCLPCVIASTRCTGQPAPHVADAIVTGNHSNCVAAVRLAEGSEKPME
jgi:hypothetical protein